MTPSGAHRQDLFPFDPTAAPCAGRFVRGIARCYQWFARGTYSMRFKVLLPIFALGFLGTGVGNLAADLADVAAADRGLWVDRGFYAGMGLALVLGLVGCWVGWRVERRAFDAAWPPGSAAYDPVE